MRAKIIFLVLFCLLLSSDFLFASRVSRIKIPVKDVLSHHCLDSINQDENICELVLGDISSFLSDYYKSLSPHPSLSLLEENPLRIRINGLRGEVIKEHNPVVAYWFGKDWRKNEMLVYSVSCSMKDYNFIEVTFTADGKIASGLISNPRRSAYMHMEIDHQGEFEEYVDYLVQKIRSTLY